VPYDPSQGTLVKGWPNDCPVNLSVKEANVANFTYSMMQEKWKKLERKGVLEEKS